MSTAIWGEQADETYPASLLKQLLYQMMMQFAAYGACLAWYDPHKDQMVIRQHMRLRNTAIASLQRASTETNTLLPFTRRTTVNLTTDPSMSAIGRFKTSSQLAEALEDISPNFFPVGAGYSFGEDLIGHTWQKDAAYILPFEHYIESFQSGNSTFSQGDPLPSWLLVAPIRQTALLDEMHGKKPQQHTMGIIVLYQNASGAVFQQRQRQEAMHFTERIALYVENDQLRRLQQRTNDYTQQLMKISVTFPSTVRMVDVVREAVDFTNHVIDTPSILVTLYDRDRNRIYDIFASKNGQVIDGVAGKATLPEDRPLWWQLVQDEQKTLVFAPNQEYLTYAELLEGPWGDQSQTRSFLLLPMKIFHRVIGSFCITSTRPDAFQAEEIQILEIMVQIITVGIENARLYNRAHVSLQEARQREELLAAMNSALQSISSVLNSAELLYKFVESVARLVQAEMCVFFQLSLPDENLVSQAVYARTSIPQDDGSERSPQHFAHNKDEYTELIGKIHLPFKDSILEQLVKESFFYLEPHMVEELAKQSPESGAIFLLETKSHKLLMLPVRYQTELIGILAVHATWQNSRFLPNQVGMLLALCAQAASAIRNAEAYTEMERMDKLKDEFLVTVSHELRTPLSAISGYTSLLKRQSGRINSQQILRFATKIASATQQMSDLVANMTDAARLGTVDRKLGLQISPVEMRSTIEVAVNLISVNIEQKISAYVEPDLWVSGDPLRVRQVISNLLDNAAKYSGPNTHIEIVVTGTMLSQLPMERIDPELTIDRHDDQPVVLVCVRDEGEGILRLDQARIFEKFVRAPRSLTTPIRGSGMGLYICRRYIEAMGGKIWLGQSELEKGSVFSFYLPRVSAPILLGEQDESITQTP